MKLAKLSLAAIMAAGAFSVANATPLEDAIKGVDLSGHAYYRLHRDSGSKTYSKVEIRAGLTAPIQENVQYVFRATMDRATSINSTVGKGAFLVDRSYVNYTGLTNTTVSLGRMYAGTPLDDTDAVGLKVVATPVKGLALAAAYFSDNSAATNALTAVAAIYSNDMFNGRAWYVHADSADTTPATTAVDLVTGAVVPVAAVPHPGANWIFVEGGVNVGPVALKAQYAQKDPDATGAPTASTIRIQAKAKYNAFGVRVGYITNDKKAGDVTIDGSWEGDNDLIYGGIYGLVQNIYADENAYFGEVSGSFGKFSAKAGYVSYDNTPYDYQYYGQVNYQVTKKFGTYIRVGSASPVASGADDKTLARFQAQYNF